MHVVLDTPDIDRIALKVAKNRRSVRKQLPTNLWQNERVTVLSAEDDVHVYLGKGLRHK
jgi:hypothetical protein